ncbi:MAG: DUF3618 domain-containing protein [Marmoricola sp.]
MGQAVEEPMISKVERTRADLSRDVDALYDKVSPGRIVERRKRAVSGRLSSVRDSVMGTAHQAGAAAQDATQNVRGAASDATDSAAQAGQAAVRAGQQAIDKATQQTQGAPLAAGLAAFSAGMVIAALIPASSAEEAAAQRLTDAVKDSPIVDEAKAAGREVGEHLKSSASEAVDEVKASAQESVATVKDEAQSATEAVKQQVPGT